MFGKKQNTTTDIKIISNPDVTTVLNPDIALDIITGKSKNKLFENTRIANKQINDSNLMTDVNDVLAQAYRNKAIDVIETAKHQAELIVEEAQHKAINILEKATFEAQEKALKELAINTMSNTSNKNVLSTEAEHKEIIENAKQQAALIIEEAQHKAINILEKAEFKVQEKAELETQEIKLTNLANTHNQSQLSAVYKEAEEEIELNIRILNQDANEKLALANQILNNAQLNAKAIDENAKEVTSRNNQQKIQIKTELLDIINGAQNEVIRLKEQAEKEANRTLEEAKNNNLCMLEQGKIEATELTKMLTNEASKLFKEAETFRDSKLQEALFEKEKMLNKFQLECAMLQSDIIKEKDFVIASGNNGVKLQKELAELEAKELMNEVINEAEEYKTHSLQYLENEMKTKQETLQSEINTLNAEKIKLQAEAGELNNYILKSKYAKKEELNLELNKLAIIYKQKQQEINTKINDQERLLSEAFKEKEISYSSKYQALLEQFHSAVNKLKTNYDQNKENMEKQLKDMQNNFLHVKQSMYNGYHSELAKMKISFNTKLQEKQREYVRALEQKNKLVLQETSYIMTLDKSSSELFPTDNFFNF